MAQGWKNDKRFSDKFIGDIGAICGRYMIGPSRVDDDQQLNTDMMVLMMRDVRIACRVRYHKWAAACHGEFTIRAGRPSGNRTELDKVVSGWGDYLFYGFADRTETSICAWFLGDLAVFRRWVCEQMATSGGVMPGERRDNQDGSSWFMVYRLDDLPPDFIVARQLVIGARANGAHLTRIQIGSRAFYCVEHHGELQRWIVPVDAHAASIFAMPPENMSGFAPVYCPRCNSPVTPVLSRQWWHCIGCTKRDGLFTYVAPAPVGQEARAAA